MACFITIQRKVDSFPTLQGKLRKRGSLPGMKIYCTRQAEGEVAAMKEDMAFSGLYLRRASGVVESRPALQFERDLSSRDGDAPHE
ncbi:hypothetical protein D3C87_1500560 [compost metagenome]